MDWVRQRDRRSEGILGPVVEHRNPLARGKYEFWDIDGVGKRVLAQWLVSVVITVAARIRAGVMQLRHRRAEQRLGLGLNRLVEPGIQRSRKLASHHNRRIKLNSRVATKSFKEDGCGRAAESLLDRGERLVVELYRGKRLSAFGLGCSDLCITPRHGRNLTRRWRRFQRRRTGVHRISLRQRRLIVMGRGLLGHLELAVARYSSFGGQFLRWCGF